MAAVTPPCLGQPGSRHVAAGWAGQGRAGFWAHSGGSYRAGTVALWLQQAGSVSCPAPGRAPDARPLCAGHTGPGRFRLLPGGPRTAQSPLGLAAVPRGGPLPQPPQQKGLRGTWHEGASPVPTPHGCPVCQPDPGATQGSLYLGLTAHTSAWHSAKPLFPGARSAGPQHGWTCALGGRRGFVEGPPAPEPCGCCWPGWGRASGTRAEWGLHAPAPPAAPGGWGPAPPLPGRRGSPGPVRPRGQQGGPRSLLVVAAVDLLQLAPRGVLAPAHVLQGLLGPSEPTQVRVACWGERAPVRGPPPAGGHSPPTAHTHRAHTHSLPAAPCPPGDSSPLPGAASPEEVLTEPQLRADAPPPILARKGRREPAVCPPLETEDRGQAACQGRQRPGQSLGVGAGGGWDRRRPPALPHPVHGGAQ